METNTTKVVKVNTDKKTAYTLTEIENIFLNGLEHLNKNEAQKKTKALDFFINLSMSIDNIDNITFEVRRTQNGFLNLGELVECCIRRALKKVKKLTVSTAKTRGFDFVLDGKGYEIKTVLINRSTPVNSNCTILVVSYNGIYLIPPKMANGERLSGRTLQNKYNQYFNRELSEAVGII